MTLDKTFCESKNFKMWIEEGILVGEFSEGLIVTLDVAREVVDARLRISKGKNYPVLADIRGIQGTMLDAREYLASPLAFEFVSAGGILVNSAFTQYMGNTFLSLNHAFKPNKPPAKLFTEFSEATAWLSKYKELGQTA